MKEGTNYVARIQEEKGKKGDYFWYLAIVDYAIGRFLFWSEKPSFVAKSSYQILVASEQQNPGKDHNDNSKESET
jgi:hypothetical protein